MGAITAALLNFLFFHTGLRAAAAGAVVRDDAAATH
jgi:hypothetical protein